MISPTAIVMNINTAITRSVSDNQNDVAFFHTRTESRRATTTIHRKTRIHSIT